METVWLVQVSSDFDRKVEAVCATETAALRVAAELHEREDHSLDLESYADGSALCRGLRACGVTVARAEVSS